MGYISQLNPIIVRHEDVVKYNSNNYVSIIINSIKTMANI
jgi:hypothetical protein